MDHRLLKAGFEFDDLVCRRVMMLRGDVAFFDATQTLSECLALDMVVDEHGTVAGAVTLENVLEQIVGPLEYEFDSELPDIVRDGPGRPLRRPANETNGFGGPTVGINAAILGPVRGVNGSRKHGHDPEPAMDLLDHAQILTV